MKRTYIFQLHTNDGVLTVGFYPTLSSSESMALRNLATENMSKAEVRQAVQEFAAKLGKTAVVGE